MYVPVAESELSATLVITTSLAPAVPAGVVAEICVESVTLTDVAWVPPIVTVTLEGKFVPVIVTVVPPAVGPLLGVIPEYVKVLPATAGTARNARVRASIIARKQKFLFIPVKSGMMVVDQRRAQERILYERFLTILKTEKIASQQLLSRKPSK